MRATMYGHDVHRFDLEPPPAADREPPQPAASTSTALVVADPARQQVEAVPGAVGRSTSDPFQPVMLGMGEAERLPRSARRSGAYVPPRPSSRIPLASRIMFGVGLGALLLAAAFWYQTSTGGGATSEAPPAPAPAQPAHAAQPATPIQAAPAAPAPERAAVPPPAPERPSVASTPTPIPAAPVAIPRSAQLRLSNPPPPPRTPQPPHRHHEVKPEVGEPTEVGEALLPFAPSVGEKTAEPKDVKERATDTAAREPKDVKETKEMKAKESADLKPAIEPKPAFEPKETKETKETKAKKSAKGRTGDVDATLPPSAD
jgi:hypothetical protein